MKTGGFYAYAPLYVVGPSPLPMDPLLTCFVALVAWYTHRSQKMRKNGIYISTDYSLSVDVTAGFPRMTYPVVVVMFVYAIV